MGDEDSKDGEDGEDGEEDGEEGDEFLATLPLSTTTQPTNPLTQPLPQPNQLTQPQPNPLQPLSTTQPPTPLQPTTSSNIGEETVPPVPGATPSNPVSLSDQLPLHSDTEPFPSGEYIGPRNGSRLSFDQHSFNRRNDLLRSQETNETNEEDKNIEKFILLLNHVKTHKDENIKNSSELKKNIYDILGELQEYAEKI